VNKGSTRWCLRKRDPHHHNAGVQSPRFRSHRISAAVKEGSADCISVDEVAAALKNMKRHKAPGFLGASIRNNTSHKGYWSTVDIGFV